MYGCVYPKKTCDIVGKHIHMYTSHIWLCLTVYPKKTCNTVGKHIHVYTCAVHVQLKTLQLYSCTVHIFSHSIYFYMQLIASEQKNMDLLQSLCDFAILRGFSQLRDSVRNLLKLLATGQL